jgi:hypothetical protein
MSLMTQLAVLFGALAGLGVAVIVHELTPAQPDLSDALSRLQTRQVPTSAGGAESGLQERVGLLLQRRAGNIPGFRVPVHDLQIVRIPAHQWLGEKALLGLLGLVFPPVVSLMLAFLGVSLPVAVPALGSLVLGVLLFLAPSISLRERAGRARDTFARTVGAYIEMVALERLAGAGTISALENGASIGESWAIQRIREELTRSRLDGVPPWRGLATLADELRVPELRDLADIVKLAGEEGAQVYESLRARGRSLRNQLLTAEQAKANASSETMFAPLAMLAVIFAFLLMVPAIITILG